MQRLAEERLKFWLSCSRNALLIEGARQVGKTYLVHQFIHERKVPSLEINFLLQKDYLNALKRATSIKDMVRLFSLFFSEQLIKGESVIEIDGKILPIEVKSGKDFKKHQALDKFIEEKEFKVEEGYVLSNNNIVKEGKITYLPIYMTMFIKKPKPKDVFLKKIEGL